MRIAACDRSRLGKERCGDAFLVAALDPNGRPRCLLRSDGRGSGVVRLVEVDESEPLLLAVIDGVGHGRAARDAANLVVEALLVSDCRDLSNLVRGCHRRAAASRGATAGIVLFALPARQLSVVGVGDVRVELGGPAGGLGQPSPAPRFRSGFRTFVMNSGTLGHNLPPKPLVQSCAWGPSSTLFMCSDGIAEGFCLGALPDAKAADPREAAEWIVAAHGLGSDDATVIVGR